MNEVVNDPEVARERLQPFLELDLLSWKGLPPLALEILNAALGDPTQREETELGWYPAERYIYKVDASSGGLAAYVRNNSIILIEALVPPPLSVKDGLGEPSLVKPHEILKPNAYVHEYLYCERGLVLSLAEPFQKGQPFEIVRCRGIQPLESPEQFGPELYRSFEDEIAW